MALQGKSQGSPAHSLYLGLLSAHARNDTPSRGPAARANHKARQPARLRGQSWAGRGGGAGTPGPPRGAPGAWPHDPNLASRAPSLIRASRYPPPPGKPDCFCLGAEIRGRLAFFQTSPTSFTELPPSTAGGSQRFRNRSEKAGREREGGGKHSCCFGGVDVWVCVYCPGKRKASERGLAASHQICLHSVISVPKRKRPAPDCRAVNEPTQGGWRICSRH